MRIIWRRALLNRFECAPELAELTGHEIAAPPTALYAKDLKSGDNVTTPAQAWLYWNTLQHKRSSAEVLAIAMRLAREAVATAVAQFEQRARSLKQDTRVGEIPVLTYAELVAGLDMTDSAPSSRGAISTSPRGPWR